MIDTERLPLLLREHEAARFLGVSFNTMRRLRASGDGPAFIKPTVNTIRYATSALDAWVHSRTQRETLAHD